MKARRRMLIDRPCLYAGAALAAGVSGAVSAQAVMPASELEMVVVTGTRLFETQARLPYSMTLIDQAAVEARNPASLPDLLGEQTGLHVSQPGGGGGVTSLFIRGGEPNFATVLIDGVKMNDPNNTRGGSFDISSFSIGDVERIEIVRGPQSAIYGSDSLSGVVNLITQAGAPKWGLDVSAEGGTHEYYNLAAAVAGPVTSKGGFTLRAATRDDGTSIDGSSFENTTVNAKLVLDEGTGWDLAIHGRYADTEGSAFPEDSGGPDYAVIRDRDHKSATDSAFGIDGGVAITPAWTLRGTAYIYDHDDTFSSPGIAPGVRDGVPPRKADSSLTRDYRLRLRRLAGDEGIGGDVRCRLPGRGRQEQWLHRVRTRVPGAVELQAEPRHRWCVRRVAVRARVGPHDPRQRAQ